MKFIKSAFVKIIIFFRLVLIGCVLFVSVYGTYIFTQSYKSSGAFDLKKIIVKNNRLLTPGDIISLSGIRRGVRIGDIDITEAENKINSSPYIKRSGVKRKYPATIEITVCENEPVAYYNFSGTLKYVSEKGSVLGSAKPGDGYDLPVFISMPEEMSVDFINECIKTSPFTYHHISEIAKTERGIELYLIKSSAPVIIGPDEFRKKIVVLENFLKNEYNELSFSRIEYIDLRFDRQVVLKEFSIAEK
jgi:cell division septal protein FtsQ